MTERSKKENVFRTMENDNVVFRHGSSVLVAQPLTVVRALTSNGGGRVTATPPNMKPNSDEFEACKSPMIKVKGEPQEEDVKPFTVCSQSAANVSVEPRSMLLFDDFLKATNTQVATVEESMKSMEVESTIQTKTQELVKAELVDESLKPMEVEPSMRTEEEAVNVNMVCDPQESVTPIKEPTRVQPNEEASKEKETYSDELEVLKVVKGKESVNDELEVLKVVKGKQAVNDEVRVSKVVKKEAVEEKIPNLEDGEFPVEHGWSLLGRKIEVATSTARGLRRLADNEIVYFNFPDPNTSYKFQWIVRVSTKRSGVVIIISINCNSYDLKYSIVCNCSENRFLIKMQC